MTSNVCVGPEGYEISVCSYTCQKGVKTMSGFEKREREREVKL